MGRSGLASGRGVGYIGQMHGKRILAVAVATALLALGCSKRQLGPAILAGAGGASVVAGVAYRAALPEEDSSGLFGKTTSQKATTAILWFGGAALILAGVIWSATTPVCETDMDCWTGDVCETKTNTCVPAPPKEPDGEEAQAMLNAAHLASFDPCARLPEMRPERFRLRLDSGYL